MKLKEKCFYNLNLSFEENQKFITLFNVKSYFMIRDISLVSDDSELVKCVEYYCSVLHLNLWAFSSTDDLFASLRKKLPGLLLIDFVLDDINGGGLCHQLKCEPLFQDLPVAILTEFFNLERLAPKFGCSYLLPKPLALSGFLSLIQKLSKLELQN
jgi:FixJ family two-component response regulator